MKFKKIMSLASLACAAIFGAAGLLLPPKGEISGSTLILIAQFLTMSGTFMGLDVYLYKFIETIKEQKE